MLFLPSIMPLEQDVFDLGSVDTGSQFLISEAIG